MMDVKMTDQFAGHEIAGHEHDRHKNAFTLCLKKNAPTLKLGAFFSEIQCTTDNNTEHLWFLQCTKISFVSVVL